MVKKNNLFISKYHYIPCIAEYTRYLNLDKSKHTLRMYLTSIERFFDFMKVETTESISKIISGNIREYQFKLKDDGLQSSSINAHIRALKALFSWLLENEYINENPFGKVRNMKEPKKSLSYLSEEEVTQMFTGCKNIEEKTILALFLSLGLRRSELVDLKVNDIKDYQVNIVGKGSKYRSLYLQDDVYKLLNEFLSVRKHQDFEYVFRSKMGNKYTTEAIRQKIKSIAGRAGIEEERIEDITPHTLRRTAATNLVEGGTDIRVIQGVLGHSALSTTMRYANLRNSAVEKAMRGQKQLIL